MTQEKLGKKAIRSKAKCTMCGTQKGVLRKYGLHICRRCFKNNAERLGFHKYD